jgi:hypothetical protein
MGKDIEQKTVPGYLVIWEKVGETTYRYRIPGLGWLIKHEDKLVTNSVGISICFIPDPTGTWI